MSQITKQQREEIVANEKKKIAAKFMDERCAYTANNSELKENNFEIYWAGIEEIWKKEEHEIHKLYLENNLCSPYQKTYAMIDMIEASGMKLWHKV